MSDSFATPGSVACQAPLSMGFPRQEYWCGLPFPSPGDLPDSGIESVFPALTGRFFTTGPPHRVSCTWTYPHNRKMGGKEPADGLPWVFCSAATSPGRYCFLEHHTEATIKREWVIPVEGYANILLSLKNVSFLSLSPPLHLSLEKTFFLSFII